MNENFNGANMATQEMFENEQTMIEGANNPQSEVDTQVIQGDDAMIDTAVQTAEVAAQVANEKDAELQQVLQELNYVKEQNNNLQNEITQMSEVQKQSIADTAIQMPILDISNLAFDDEDTIKIKQSEYAKQMSDYVKGSMMEELSPFLQQAKDGMYQKEKAEVISALSDVPELNGISDMLPQLDRIIENNKALKSDDIPIDEKYITAYAIAKGVNSINTPPKKELTPEELLNMYENNTEFQDLIEKKRLNQIKDSQQVPPLSASSGAVSAALNIKEKPKTFEEASKLTQEMFGL